MASYKTDSLKKAMIEALTGRLGNITNACKDVGIARQTHYEWYREDEAYKQAVDEMNEIALDFAEDKLFQRITGVEGVKMTSDGGVVYEIPPDTTAIIFYLKTRGKKRGYIERNEFSGPDGQPLIWNETKTYDPDPKANDGD